MQPNIVQPGDGSSSESQPPMEPETAPINSATTGPAKKNRLKLILPLVAAVILLIVLGTLGYSYYQKQASTKKFDDLALKITKQEKDGAASYVKVAANLDDISQLISINGGGAANTDKLNAKVDSLNSLVSQACNDKTSDLTASSINSQSKGWKLSVDQKRYLSDWQQVISNLEGSEYSNTGVCKDGTTIVIFAKNFAKFLPGLDALDTIGNGNGLPSADQMKALNDTASLQITDEAQLKAALPKTATFLTDLKTLIGDLYYELDAIQKGDSTTAAKYDSEVTSLSTKFDQDSSAVDAELTALDKRVNDAATKASNIEISGIEYQKTHGEAGNSNMQLDATLPAFRIVEAEITNYSDSHNGSFPHAADIDGLASIVTNVNNLKEKGYLKTFSYASTGSDDSGFSLQATMKDGTVLKEKVTPGSQSA